MCIRDRPPHDHLAVAHVVFLDLRAFADPAELRQRIPRVALVLGANDLFLIRARHDPQLGKLGVGKEIEGHEVGAGFFSAENCSFSAAWGLPFSFSDTLPEA